MIPATIHPNVQSEAERRLFGIIRDIPGMNHWQCLHSLGLARHTKKRRGEIDFLLLTQMGIFVLEVKGGRVSRREGVWQFTDRYGRVHEKNESPFDQASSAMFALERDIRTEFRDDQRLSRLLFGYGAMFPDITFEEIGCEADRRLIYDVRDREKPITQYIDRLADFARERESRSRYNPNENDIQSLVDFLRPDFDLIPSLGIQANTAVEKLLSLAREQYAVIDAWEQYNHPRIFVQGGAGTGKTLLALETAIRESRNADVNVLLLCFNRLLARFFEQTVEVRCAHHKITIKSIYSLLNDLICASSLSEEFEKMRTKVDASTLYHRIYPEYALLALAELKFPLINILILDEAQDMMSSGLLDVIDALVEGGLRHGQWRIFCDANNQASVFGVFEQDAMEQLMSYGQSLILVTNRRNTKPVAEETSMLTRPRIIAHALISGIPVEYNWYETMQAQSLKLSTTLIELLNQGIASSRITVLSPRNNDKCCAAAVSNPNLVPVNWNNVCDIATGQCQYISYSTISAFKGLENDFIVLTDIEDMVSEWWRSVIYVGMSRARVGLHVFLHDSLRGIYETRLRDWLKECDIKAAQSLK